MIQKLKGTRDILPEEVKLWQYIENISKNVFENYGYDEIRVPVIEALELFQRGVGEATDVVQKEMYNFEDKGGRKIALRPEGTAGVVRAYIENGMSSSLSPVKLWYHMPMYRYENVQKGRQREFNQLGVELFGAESYLADTEVIEMCDMLFKKLNINDIELNINSIGCSTCRKEYLEALKEYIRPNLEKYCTTCKTRFEKNPMRILDCKEENCKKLNKDAPKILDSLCEECKNHFENVKNRLDKLEIKYKVDSNIVRGLDYYTKTVFEFISKIDGLTVLAGGRYDGLVEELGGMHTPAIGFASGMERLIEVFKLNNKELDFSKSLDIFVASIGDEADIYCAKLVKKLREKGILAEKDIMERSIKAQFIYADKNNAKFVLTIFDEEINNNEAKLKCMNSGKELEIKLDDINELIKTLKNQ